jgi:hypothetical protein
LSKIRAAVEHALRRRDHQTRCGFVRWRDGCVFRLAGGCWPGRRRAPRRRAQLHVPTLPR